MKHILLASVITLAAMPALAQGMMKNDSMSKDSMSKDATSGRSVTVGGAPMYSNKNIIENAVNSKDHTTLVAAVKAAGLVETLQGKGPFTVFAPTNAAFEKLPAGTVETLVKPENKEKLTGILTYHVVAGANSAAEIKAMIEKGGGKAEWKTVNGETLTGSMSGEKLVIHVIDTVLLPG
jgi:pentapeptide MXKDX repeat protein